MTSYRAPTTDIAFALDYLVDVDELCELEKFAELDPDTIKGVIEEAGRFLQEVIGPLNQPADIEGVDFDPSTGDVTTATGFVEAYSRFVDGGWGGVPFPAEYGGGGFPWLIGIVIQEMLSSSCLAFSMAPLLTQGAIDLILYHGTEEQRELYLPRMVTGEWTGTMNLTEPQAGSDVGALTTKAVPANDGSWRITGTKIFISFGDHDMAENIIHLVLARTPDAPPGTRGISCFVVPKFLVNDDGSVGDRNDVVCTSVEHKMGINASPTCVMSFGDGGEGAVGYLVGEANQGMRYMFTMMNNARLSVGLEGLAVAERAYQGAVEYARERRQGRAPGASAGEQSPIVDHPDVRRMLLTMKSSVEAMRALIYVNAEAIDLSRYHPDPGIREMKADLVELLTPITKAWCTDMAVEVASMGIQVHGGMGYIEETGAAQHLRDVRITTIYEGTNGIQAMDLVGRKLPLKGGEVVKDLLSMMAALDTSLARFGDETAAIREHFATALTALVDTTSWLFECGLTDPSDALAGATPYLEMFGTVIGGWLMGRQALLALEALRRGDGDPSELRARISTARFYAENILPSAGGLVPAVRSGADALFEIDAEDLA